MLYIYMYGLFLKNYDSGCGIKNALVLVQRTSFQQVIGLYTLQCQSEFTKVTNQSSKSLFRRMYLVDHCMYTLIL